MAKQTISKFVSIAALGLLVLIFGLLLLALGAQLFVARTAGIGGFAFGISARAFAGALLAVPTVLAVALFFVARARRRRHLN